MSWTFYTASGVAKTAEYIGSEFPIGTVVQTTGLTAPSGWKICDGSALSRTTYSDLYATIGTTYGSGNGSTTFNIPDASGKMIYVLSLATRMTTGTLAPATGDLTGTYPSLTIPSGTITADKIADSNVTTAKLATGATSATYVTSLPSSPVDGQEIYYAADAANGVIWHLRYRAAAVTSYRWEFVGGTPLINRSTGIADEATHSNVSGAAFSNVMTLTAPLQGVYQVHVAFRCIINSRTTNSFGIYTSMGVRPLNGGAIITDDFTGGYLGNGVETGTQGVPQLVHYAATRATLTTQLSLEGIYVASMSSGSGVVRFRYREIGLTPIRVIG